MVYILLLTCLGFCTVMQASDTTMLVPVQIDQKEPVSIEVPSEGHYSDIIAIAQKKFDIPKLKVVPLGRGLSPDTHYTRQELNEFLETWKTVYLASTDEVYLKNFAGPLSIPLGGTVANTLDAYKREKKLAPDIDLEFTINRGPAINPATRISEIKKNYNDEFFIVEISKVASKKSVIIEAPGDKQEKIEYGPDDTIEDITTRYRKKLGVGEKYEIRLSATKSFEPKAKAWNVIKSDKIYAMDFVRQ